MKYKRPRICGHCIYYENGFCLRNEDEPKARDYIEVACNFGK
jgi:hypothetical protein